jgi:outer membrane protein OmpA-like peptidoglycan-associated protein
MNMLNVLCYEVSGGGLMKKTLAYTLVFCFLVCSWSCASWSKTKKGAAIGAAGGAVVGGVIGRAAGSTIIGAILGAAIGGAAGAYIGRYMDRQAAEMRKDLEGAKVERIGEGIKITFDSGLLFDVDKSELRDTSKANLIDLARILNKYPDTNILMEGHTDSTGSDEYNLKLSKERAEAVAFFLAESQVSSGRFSTKGYGEAQPIATNDTAEGRQQNRRVDVAIMANDKLKKAATESTKGTGLGL